MLTFLYTGELGRFAEYSWLTEHAGQMLQNASFLQVCCLVVCRFAFHTSNSACKPAAGKA